MSRPRRRWKVEIQADGDTWEDAASMLREMADEVEEHGSSCDFVAGGASRGGFIRITEVRDMTHEKYHAELRAWLDAERDVMRATEQASVDRGSK